MTQMARRMDNGEDGIEITNPEMLASVGVRRVQTKYVTAMEVPVKRTLPLVEKRSLDEAAMLGADGYYAWGNGKDRIEGPTVGMAMCLARCWGNCSLDMGEVQETRDAWIFTAMFVDLETGFTYARQFRQSKDWTVYGKHDEARKKDIRFQIGQSKAIRNVILRALPEWLVRRAMDKAKGGVREMIEKAIAAKGMDAILAIAIEKCAKVGATEARVLESLGRKARGALTVEDLVLIQGNIAAIESGADDVESVFPIKAAAAQPLPPGTNASDALADTIGGAPASTGEQLQAALDAEAKGKGEQGSLIPEGGNPVGTVDRRKRT